MRVLRKSMAGGPLEFAIAGDKWDFLNWVHEDPEARGHVQYTDNPYVLKGVPDDTIVHRVGSWREQSEVLLLEVALVEGRRERSSP